MTIGAAARWAGVSPRMLGLMLTGRLIAPTSELDVDVAGLDPKLVSSMPGKQATQRWGAERRTRRGTFPTS